MTRRVDKDVALAELARWTAALPAGRACHACHAVAANGTTHVAANVHGVVVLNRFASRPGHLLVFSRSHVETLSELPWAEFRDVQLLVHQAARVLHAHFRPARIYTAMLGSPESLGMTYPHVHAHVVPVFERDDRARPARVLTWSEGVWIYEDAEAAELSETLRMAWPRD